jgi:uncharacterized protein involved in exopolysaccharide biosynthesis
MLRLALLRVLESYFRHRWLYLLPIVVMILASIVYLVNAKPKYVAAGVFYVQKQTLLATLNSVGSTDVYWQTPASIALGEIGDLLQTDSFIRAIIEKTDLEASMNAGQDAINQTISDVRKDVWVSSIGTNQVRLSAASEDPGLAYQLANGMIDTYIQWKINADLAESEAAHTFFNNLIDGYKADLDQARQSMDNYLSQHPEPIKGNRPVNEQMQISRLQGDIDLAQTRYTSALNKDEDARLASAQAESNVHQSYVVIDSPLLPIKPETSLKKIALSMALFVLIGIIISGVGVIGGAFLDRSFRFPLDVWYGVNLPVLAMVPAEKVPGKKRFRFKRTAAQPDEAPNREPEIYLKNEPEMGLGALTSSKASKK